MKWLFNEGVIRFIFVMVVSMAVSSLLLTIEWFTWGAWLFVSLILMWKYYLVNADAHNTAGLWRGLFGKLDEINKK